MSVIVQIVGGLGNQMFQYAMGRAVAKKLNTSLKLDLTMFKTYHLHKYQLDSYEVPEEIASPDEVDKQKHIKQGMIDRFLGRSRKVTSGYVIESQHFKYDPLILGSAKDVYLEGYWQTEKYFLTVEQEIRQSFSLKGIPNKKNGEFLSLIGSTNSVSLHVRRGDYVANSETNKIHGTCDLEYYSRAIEYIRNVHPNVHLFLFSDDLNWVVENLVTSVPFTAVDINDRDSGFEDLRLMSACKHNIIANSTFSWWGAWLGRRDGRIVVAPQRWFNSDQYQVQDLIPERWSRL